MAYQKKPLYQVAKELNCNEDELIEFLIAFGYYNVTRKRSVFEDGYLAAREHFLGIPNPNSKRKPQEKPKSSPPISKPEPLVSKPALPKVDYKQILAKHDAAETSPIKYFAAVRSVVDELLDILQQHESAQAEAIASVAQIGLKLSTKYIDSPHLTPEENSLLAERQKFLAEKISLGTDKIKARLLSVKEHAEKFFERLEKINDGEKIFSELAAIESEPRPSFAFLAENLSQVVQSAMLKPEFLASNEKLISIIAEAQTSWSNDYKSFKTGQREELAAACRNERIEEENFSEWYDDWQRSRFAIEQRFLPLAKFALDGHFQNAIYDILGNLQGYRNSVDEFYLHERKNIYRKFAFTAGGDLQEKFETESELYKLAEKFQRDLQAIIFSCDKTEERIFLLKWSEPLLNLPLDEISNFIRELDSIPQDVLNQFAELRQQNFAEYLSDSKAYGEALKRRENDYNALIFHMRRSLARQKN
ncbi:MAG: hypothetical protein IJQ85_06535 [Selenomonadaceae bacterium]|nr:hypothetical protein [Selenomonadaceae bacterium]